MPPRSVMSHLLAAMTTPRAATTRCFMQTATAKRELTWQVVPTMLAVKNERTSIQQMLQIATTSGCFHLYYYSFLRSLQRHAVFGSVKNGTFGEKHGSAFHRLCCSFQVSASVMRLLQGMTGRPSFFGT